MSERFERRLEQDIAGLPRRREPAVDLWPGIEARLDRPRRRRAVPVSLAAAVAAGLALAVWFGGPGMGPATDTKPAGTPIADRAAPDTHLLRQAELVDRSYRAALLAPRAAPDHLSREARRALAAELAALDGAQERIREAMNTQPDGEYLLSLLAQTHALRLDLINRLAGGPAHTGGHHENGNV